jgi:hypothetical protein
MWHQTGTYDTPVARIEIRPPEDPQYGNLASLLGMHFQKKGLKVGEDSGTGRLITRPIGQLPEQRKIKEAVVAIPFTEGEGKARSFFNLPRPEVYQSVVNLGHAQYKRQFLEESKQAYVNTIMQNGSSDNEDMNRIVREFRDSNGFTDGNRGAWDATVDRLIRVANEQGMPVRSNIQKMVKSMMNYVLPPKFNFLKYNNTNKNYVRPFLMYVFEFEHTLSKKDVAYIWQNTAPDLALNMFHNNDRDTLVTQASVTHDLSMTGDDMYGGTFGENVKWLVFKVKQRAENNYFKKMKRDRLPANHPHRALNVEDDIFEYGYNWPYDYFSMIELVRLDTEVVYNTPELSAQGTTDLLQGVNRKYSGLPGGDFQDPFDAINYGFPTGESDPDSEE